MLTPAQLRAHRFVSSVRGAYKSEDVDSFFEEVLASYEQLFKENTELIKKISLLAERVEEYKNDEDNIKIAILTAQRMADQITKEANEKARNQLDEASHKLETVTIQANTQAQQIIDTAQKKAHDDLLSAEARAAQIISDSERRARDIAVSAQKEATEHLENAKVQVEVERYTLEMLKKESMAFKEELIEKYNKHLDYIRNLPEAVSTMLNREKAEETKDIQNEPISDVQADNNTITVDKPVPEVFQQEEPLVKDIVTEENGTEKQDTTQQYIEPEKLNFEKDQASESEEAIPVLDEIKDDTQVNNNVDEIQYSSLYALRQKAMDQQKELFDEENVSPQTINETDVTDDASSLHNEFSAAIQTITDTNKDIINETEENILYEADDEEAEDAGFRMYLENYKGDEIIIQETDIEDPPDRTSLLDTVEYNEEDDEDGNDETSQSLFKGFFKK